MGGKPLLYAALRGVPGSLVGGLLTGADQGFNLHPIRFRRATRDFLSYAHRRPSDHPIARRPLPFTASLLAVLLIAAGGCSKANGPVDDPRLASSVAGAVGLEPVGVFFEPIHVTAPHGDRRLFIVERRGQVKILVDGAVLDKPFLDLTRKVSREYEQGLLSIAFSPDYSASGRAYVSYTDRIGNSRIVEYKVDPSDANRLDPSSRRLVLLVNQNSPIHNGGLIGFDSAGMLLVAFGDGGPGGPAQDPTSFLGKLLRIDPKKASDALPYSIPLDNPFVAAEGVMPESWGFGLRNPWRWALDPETEDLYVADVGESAFEEINYVPRPRQRGANYGWPSFEGNEAFVADHPISEEELVNPVLTYSHSETRCAVVGGGVYRGSVAAIKGAYLYGDFCDGVIRGFRVTEGVAEELSLSCLTVPHLVSFGEDSYGEMYAVLLKGGLFRFTGA